MKNIPLLLLLLTTNLYASSDLRLKDLYAFREDWQTTGASTGNLILIMTALPGALPKQQYFFSPVARYEFHLSRAGSSAQKANAPTGSDDISIRFQFSEPDTNSGDSAYNTQSINISSSRDGVSDGFVNTNNDGSQILTTTAVNSQGGTLTQNNFSLGGAAMTLFVGARQDPRFFDLVHFFELKGTLVSSNGASMAPGFSGTTTAAIDSSTGYNVNAIALRVPITFLQRSGETVFDVWANIKEPR